MALAEKPLRSMPTVTWCHLAKAGPMTPMVARSMTAKFMAAPAAVSKCDFSTYTFALRALEAVCPRSRQVDLLFTYDEEFGGELGPAWLLAQQAHQPIC
jgi:succinyl-diaminopimelate desuccinylase